VQLVHDGVAADHALADRGVRVQQGDRGPLHRTADLVGHRHQEAADLSQLGPELFAHEGMLLGGRD
jgi:hypothetical protein